VQPVPSLGVNEWHALSVEQTLARLTTDAAAGLSAVEAAGRLGRYGRNELAGRAGPTRLQIFGNQFRDVMIWLLLVAAAVSGVLLDEWIDTGVILAIVVLNAVLGYVQEAKASDALAALKELSAPQAVVIRDGAERLIPSAELVPGDLLVLAAGDRVPADARIVDSIHLECEEGALTGESIPDAKTTEPTPVATGLGDRTSMVFAGTAVAAGRGRAVVTTTGRQTAMGEIAELLSAEEPPTPLQVELDKVGRRLAVIAVATAVGVFAIGLVRGNPAESMLLIAVALAVAAIPEGLPAVVTITLSRGVQRMAERNALVRRLPAVESLGAASVICTDKTGTLTRNEMRVQELETAGGRFRLGDADPADARVRRYLEVAALCNDARRGPDGFVGDPTEVALLLSVEAMAADPATVRAAMPRVDELAFDSRRKRMTTLHRVGGSYLVAMKGAPEIVASRCSDVLGPAGLEPLDAARRQRVMAAAESFAAAGLRTLAVAYRDLGGPPGDLESAEQGLVLAGIVAMRDEARPEAGPAVAEAQAAGIRVVMVTGDHEVTARAIAEGLGILRDGDEVMPGSVLRELTTEELVGQVDRYSVYARVDPVDKVKIVAAWQQRGEIVAMTGDGINDAPALLAADIGVAMGSGTDVAKDASSMVLADDNFATIVAAVHQGRVIFANLRKVVHFLLSANASEVVAMFVGFVIFGALGEPLTAVQLLWINLVTDGLPALTLGIDPPEEGIMGLGVQDRDILAPRHQLRLLVVGAILATATLAALAIAHYALDLDWQTVQTTTFTTLVLGQLLYVFNVRLERSSVWRHGFGGNRWLLGAIGASLLLHLGVVYLPVGHVLFDTVALGVAPWLWIVALSVAGFVVISRIKGEFGLSR
jgi:Ca2+-transporting ATPase